MTLCLQVHKKKGQDAITLLRAMKIIDKSYQILRKGEFLYIPILRNPSSVELDTNLGKDWKILETSCRKAFKRPRCLKDALALSLPNEVLSKLPKSLDIIGDIAILRLPKSLWDFRNSIGEGVLSLYRHIRLVMAEKGAVSGMERVRDLEVIAGTGSTETMHRENGCIFRLDVSRVYFSPRLSFERQRVASFVGPGETVIDLFSGVGPFAIQIAKRLKNGRVFAIDVNPYAVKYLMENVIENRVQGLVTVLEGDAREVVEERLKGIGDRIIMNLPSKAFEFLDTALKALKPEGGIIHFYSFARDPDPLKDAEETLKNSIECQGVEARVLAKRIVREIAPHKYQIVIDAFVRRRELRKKFGA